MVSPSFHSYFTILPLLSVEVLFNVTFSPSFTVTILLPSILALGGMFGIGVGVGLTSGFFSGLTVGFFSGLVY